MKWLRAPVAMTRLTLFSVTFLLGLVAASGVLAGAAALRHAAAERDRAIAAERLTGKDVAKIASRVFAIETPTRAQLLARIQDALRACARDPKCRRAFQQTIRRASIDTPRAGVAPAAVTTRLGSPARRDASRRSRRRVGRGRQRRKTSRPPGSGDGSPPADPSSGPSAPIAVSTPSAIPFRPQLCTPLVAVNC